MEQLPEIKNNQECRIKRKRTLWYCAIPNAWLLLNDNVVQLHYPRDNDGARMNKIIIPLPHRN
jgi:hypothetical protein